MKIQESIDLLHRQLVGLKLAERESATVTWESRSGMRLSDGSIFPDSDTYELMASNEGSEELKELEERLTSYNIGKVFFLLPDSKNPDLKHKRWLVNDIWFLSNGTWVTGGGVN